MSHVPTLRGPTPGRPVSRPRAPGVAAVLAGLLLVACGPGAENAGRDPGDSASASPRSDPAGPSSAPDTSPAPPPAIPSTWAYTCPDGLRVPVHYRADEARVTLPARELVLPSVPAASGTRYQAGDTVWWDKGGEALLEVGDERHQGCTGERAASPEDAARRLGFDFRGLGQEPGWLLDVDLDRQLRWVGDYGTVRFATSAPEAVVQTDSSRVWRAATGAHRITVTARDRPCTDVMSGRPFPWTVRVEVDGATLEGCGRWLDGAGAPAG